MFIVLFFDVNRGVEYLENAEFTKSHINCNFKISSTVILKQIQFCISFPHQLSSSWALLFFDCLHVWCSIESKNCVYAIQCEPSSSAGIIMRTKSGVKSLFKSRNLVKPVKCEKILEIVHKCMLCFGGLN